MTDPFELVVRHGPHERTLRFDLQSLVSLGLLRCGVLKPKQAIARLGLPNVDDAQAATWINAVCDAIKEVAAREPLTLQAITRPKGGE